MWEEYLSLPSLPWTDSDKGRLQRNSVTNASERSPCMVSWRVILIIFSSCWANALEQAGLPRSGVFAVGWRWAGFGLDSGHYALFLTITRRQFGIRLSGCYPNMVKQQRHGLELSLLLARSSHKERLEAMNGTRIFMWRSRSPQVRERSVK